MLSPGLHRLPCRAWPFGSVETSSAAWSGRPSHDLFDQRSPFGRLALTHVLMTAGDTMFAVSLAGSLFFSISPDGGQGQGAAVPAPDHGAVRRGGAGPRSGDRPQPGRPPGDGGGLGPGPGGAVPVHRPGHPLAPAVPRGVRHAGAVQGVPGHQRGAGPGDGRARRCSTRAAPPTTGDGSGPGPATTARAAAPEPPPRRTPRLPTGRRVVHVDDPGTGDGRGRARPGHPQRPARAAGLAVRLRLRPARRGHPQAGRGRRRVLWACAVVFVAAAVAGARLPVRRQVRRAPHVAERAGRTGGRPAPTCAFAPDADPVWTEDAADLAALRPIADTQVILALMPMSVLKGLVGFLTFLFAFGLRREGAATWWFGLALGAFTAGALIGVLLVARIRRVLTEQQMLTGSLWLVAVAGLLGWLFPDRAAPGAGGPGGGRRRGGGQALVRRAGPAPRARVGPGPGLRPVRDPSPADVGGRLARAAWSSRCRSRPATWSSPWWPPSGRCPT